ncbi:cytochrome P450 [Mycolicibacterium wolinskyi]|uniref:Cytochrome P450 n=1 Tax=Mycolicibacterium wolinskyi TaxID=59750 RepID=A0A132PKK3_9MYCO|nr:cytochrome P450 [Mycolicibacterium wolinskyi]KWX22871.1 cytochrome P450 [Mycolicibacterium wolinskyi]
MTSSEVVTARLPWDAADPYPFYETCRARGDVVWDDVAHGWLVLGYETARQVLGGEAWTSDPMANPIARANMDPISLQFSGRSMLIADGATHRRLRGSVRDVFTRTFVTGLAEGVDAIASAVIDEPAPDIEFDFMSQIALPIPMGVVAEWLALDPRTADLLAELSPAIIRMLGTLADTDETRAGAAAAAELMGEFLPLAADRRQHPGDDLLSFIAGDPDLELEDVVITAILIAVAGHETTANLLGAGLIRLLTELPDGTRLADHIDAADPAVMTELLRLDSPVQAALRTATEDTRIGDVAIEAGATALIVVAAANRDPQVFDDPDEFRLDRTGPAPLTFGYGAHHCLGASLARLEISTALPKILARRPRLVGGPVWRDTPAIRGALRIPMVFDA